MCRADLLHEYIRFVPIPPSLTQDALANASTGVGEGEGVSTRITGDVTNIASLVDAIRKILDQVSPALREDLVEERISGWSMLYRTKDGHKDHHKKHHDGYGTKEKLRTVAKVLMGWTSDGENWKVSPLPLRMCLFFFRPRGSS